MPYIKRFSAHLSETKIRSIFCQARFGKRVVCLSCKSRSLIKSDSISFRCRKCWYSFKLTTGTYLGRKRIPLRLWYEIAYGFAIGLSAHKLNKVLKLKSYKKIFESYKTVRKAIIEESNRDEDKFTGLVEVDESFYGGSFKNLRKEKRKELKDLGLVKRGRGAKFRKQPVFGIYKRNGKIYLQLISDTQKPILERIIKKRVKKNEKIFSDTHTGYQGLVGLGYIHRTVNHGEEEYVKGKIHINGIEGFWGLSKVNMQTYKGIKKTNWNQYLKEMEFRYNNRILEYDDLTVKIIDILCQKIGQNSFSS